MLPTLFRFPHTIGGLPVFGRGWALIAWGIVVVVTFLVAASRRNGLREFARQIPFMVMITGIILFIMPHLEERDLRGAPLGLAIRGYGVLMLIGVISGAALVLERGRRLGVDADILFSLAFWMFLFGIGGARLFYVIEYWPEFRQPTALATTIEILRFTEGGLVVYGSILGAFGAALVFLVVRRLPVLAMADLIAPSLVLGLAFGRIGCLLNGCCYGGVTEGALPKQRFPFGSHAYLRQFQTGRLLGLTLTRDAERRKWIVVSVGSGSSAAKQGVVAGDTFDALLVASNRELLESAAEDPTREVFILDSRAAERSVRWNVDGLPKSSQPVHPTQLYASLNAFLLAALAWLQFPSRRRDGVVFATLFTVYPVSRFLLEIIRSDEVGQWGTSLTISQWMCLATVVAVIPLWVAIWRNDRPATTDFERPGDATVSSRGSPP